MTGSTLDHDRPVNRAAGRVAMVVYRYNLAASPSLINTIEILVEQGYEVDIYVDQLRRREPKLYKEGVTLYTLKADVALPQMQRAVDSASSAEVARRLPNWVYPYTRRLRAAFWAVYYALTRLLQNVRLTVRWLWSLCAFMRWIRRESVPNREAYACWFGIEPDGLITAWWTSRETGSKLVYYSLELLLEENIRSWMHWLKKRLERQVNRSADLTIVQDRARAALLAKANQLSLARMMFVPVGARGSSVADRTDFLSQKYDLGPECKIILYIGSISDWSCSRELAQAALRWPAEWKLVLHGSISPLPENPGYIEDIIRIAQDDRVILSTDWVPFTQLDALVASADIGVALYFDKDRNRRLTASSSGKIAQYLKCGLPVIVNDFPHTRALIQDTECGVSVGDASEMDHAIETILSNYEYYRANALHRYTEYYQMDRYVFDVMRRLGL